MNRNYPLIVASVAAALASGYANAAPPSLAQAASPNYSLVMAGSSAAQTSVQNAFQTDVCGGAANTLVVKGTDANFVAYSCAASASSPGVTVGGITAGQIVTVYYRSEGGSVVGALPIANNKMVKRLNLSDTSCSASGAVGTCTVTGVTVTNGPHDSWGGAVTQDWVQLGVTDVEPSQLAQPNDYPSLYDTTVWGPIASGQSGLKGLTAVQAIQQVFGIAVNTSGIPLDPALHGQINLTRESTANILAGNYTDWHAVPDALTGNPIATASSSIHVINREAGSGTRTSANIYFFGYGCGGSSSVADPTPANDNYSTGDDLTAANGAPGSITYASIDNLLVPKSTAFTNLVMATLNSVTPSTLAAATGQYDYWFEATLVPNSAHVTPGSNTDVLSSYLQGDLPNLTSAPLAADINVIPFLGNNVPSIPFTIGSSERTGNQAYSPSAGVTATATISIYVNPFTRNGSSCTVPAEVNQ